MLRPSRTSLLHRCCRPDAKLITIIIMVIIMVIIIIIIIASSWPSINTMRPMP